MEADGEGEPLHATWKQGKRFRFALLRLDGLLPRYSDSFAGSCEDLTAFEMQRTAGVDM